MAGADATAADEVSIAPGDRADAASRTLSFGLGNGVLFVLAVDPEVAFGHEGPSDPVCFFAGGRLIDLPNGLALSWRHDGEPAWFRPRPDQFLRCEHRLRLSEGIAVREALVEDDAGRQTLWCETRLVSLAHAHVVLLRWELAPQNWSGPIVVRSLLDLRAQRQAAHHPAWAHGGEPHDVHDLLPDDGLAARVTGPGAGQALRVDVSLRTSGAPCRQAGRAHDHDQSYQQRRVELPPGTAVCIDVAMTVVDAGVAPVTVPAFDPELERHRAAWQGLWSRVQVSAPQDVPLERACRFNAFHLLQAVSPLSVGRDVGLPAWSAPDGALGHDAWDETMALPFYSLHLPALARELLNHRARRLGPQSARPWHGAAPMGAWRHHLATRDRALLEHASGDVLVAAARFWADRAASERSLVAAWALRCAAGLRDHLDEAAWSRLCARVQLQAHEPALWHDLSRSVPVPWHTDGVLGGDGADTLMLLHLLGEEGANDLVAHAGGRPATGWYARTVHHHIAAGGPATAVSRVVRAGALAAVDPAASWANFHAALHAPLNERPVLDAGLSFGAMGGVWDVLLRHYLGLQPEAEGLRLRPRPPEALDRVSVRVCLAGHWVTVQLQGKDLTLHTSAGARPLALRFDEQFHEVAPESTWSIRCR